MSASLKFIWGDNAQFYQRVIPGRGRSPASPESILRSSGYGFRVRAHKRVYARLRRAMGAPRNDRGLAMLEVKGIDLHYGAAQALRNVSLHARAGEVTCVLGRNGVGKTSLLDALAGQHLVSGGTILWEEEDITRLKPYERARRGIAYVPQGREIFPLLTVEENLKTGFAPLKRSDRDIPDDVFSLFPVLKDMLHRRGGDLSGGQQQQLAIGRALVMRPRLLLLDEPTEGIQPSIIKDIGRAITYLRSLGNIAIVLVEQYLDFASELGDRFEVMDRGAVVYSTWRAAMDEAALKKALAI
jgi:urea transport system ATP-binding protein